MKGEREDAVTSLDSLPTPTGVRQRRRRGFTLIEMLTVIAIIGLLMALLMPALGIVKRHAKRVKAKAEVRQIAMAWKSYLSDYRTWDQPGFSGASVQDMAREQVLWLNGNPANQGNPRGIMYMEIDATSTNSAGAFKDPWDGVYQVRLDAQYQNEVSTPIGQVFGNVAVWSKGDDRREGTEDDIKSW